MRAHTVHNDPPLASGVHGPQWGDVGGVRWAEVGLLAKFQQTVNAVLCVGKNVLVQSGNASVVVFYGVGDLVGGVLTVLQAPALCGVLAAVGGTIIVWLGLLVWMWWGSRVVTTRSGGSMMITGRWGVAISAVGGIWVGRGCVPVRMVGWYHHVRGITRGAVMDRRAVGAHWCGRRIGRPVSWGMVSWYMVWRGSWGMVGVGSCRRFRLGGTGDVW